MYYLYGQQSHVFKDDWHNNISDDSFNAGNIIACATLSYVL